MSNLVTVKAEGKILYISSNIYFIGEKSVSIKKKNKSK
jgi:hypothetical protein